MMLMMIDRILCIYFLFYSLTNCYSIDLNLSKIETGLIRMLLNESTYLKKVRPTQKVIVDIRFIFNQIISMVEKEQIIVTNCFVDQKWTDPRLQWNPLDFNNITWIRMPATSVWYPDTFLYNTADNAGFLLPQDSQNMIVNSNGTVFWPLPLAQLRTRCRMTIKHFPFDEQTCDMVFGSWSHTSSLIHYQFWEAHPELPQYTPNNEWKLLAVAQDMKTVIYPNWVEKDPFFEINFTILIIRKPLQAIYNTVVPALMLTTLTLVSFFIPFAQEMQIGISIMLAYSVFSLRLSEDVPSQSDSVHLISLYLTVCMFFSLSAMTWFAFVNKLRETRRLPYWLRWLALDYFSWLVFATSMRRKANQLAKQDTSKLLTNTPSTPESIPLQQQQQHIPSSLPTTTTTTTTTNHMPTEYSNSYYCDRDSIITGCSTKIPLLSRTQTQPLIELTHQELPSSITNETLKQRTSSPSPSTVWIRRRLTRIPLSSSHNGPINKKSSTTTKISSHSHTTTKSHHDRSISKNKESLYAIHIYNRLVFWMFFLFVISINIYTWFFYSRTVQTKLLDSKTHWWCFDELRLEMINCSTLI